MSLIVDDFLEHYGVKGMRWGVRKKDNSSGKPWSTKKKIIVGASIAAGLVATAFATKVGIDFVKAGIDYNNILNNESVSPLFEAKPSINSKYLNSKEVSETITKGHEFIRKSTVMETKIDTRAYASASKKWSENYDSYDFGDKVMSIFATKEINVPSYKQSIDVLRDGFTKKELVGTLNRSSIGRRLYQDVAMSKDQVSKLAFANLESRNWDKVKDSVVTKYFNELAKKGYSAIRDGIDGGDAFVLFDNSAFNFVPKH